ncbi:MAG TPA: hypothetical protein VHG93_04200 [Longimicrobium sp.]|nr:hypothetical protein [Longimicrobium sp.]
MHKLKLVMDDLRVESFDTTAAAGEKGTVFGEQCTCYSDCTCPGCPTCDGTCPATCPYTCDDRTCASCQGSCDSCVASCFCSMGEWCYSWTCPLD